jgi:8-oxo-dGTP pyrophosphatase MutT (NUDIX family)
MSQPADSLTQTKLHNRKRRGGIQYGVLPFAIGRKGVRLMLLTSRETRRWVIPKGWPMRNRKPREAAVQEAFEEAGLVGRILGKRAIGRYDYMKVLGPAVSVPCTVKVFLFEIDHQLDDWPEKDERETRWFSPRDAAALVAEPALAKLLMKADSLIQRATRQGR